MPFSKETDSGFLTHRVLEVLHLPHQLAYACLGLDLRVVWASANFGGMTNEKVTAVTQLPITSLIWELVGAEEALLELLQQPNLVYRLEHINREQADGSLQYLKIQVTCLDPQTTEKGLLLVVEETTEASRLGQKIIHTRNELVLTQDQLTKANRHLQELDRLKSIFLSMAAHDLRSPLAAIYGFSHLMRDRLNADEQMYELLSIIIAQSEQMQRLIQDLLDFDQIQQGKLSVTTEPCEVNQLIAGIVEGMQISLQNHQSQMQTLLPTEPTWVRLDPMRMRQILYNLIDNAIKYTPLGSLIRLSVTIKKKRLVIEVADNGPGMSKEQAAHLFELYYRTDTARKSEIKGTGIGLFVVKMLVEAQNGQITVKSAPNKGATFTMQFPLAE